MVPFRRALTCLCLTSSLAACGGGDAKPGLVAISDAAAVDGSVDAGVAKDSLAVVDAVAAVDDGNVVDVAPIVDSMVAVDVGAAVDAAPAVDSMAVVDAGAAVDAGAVVARNPMLVEFLEPDPIVPVLVDV